MQSPGTYSYIAASAAFACLTLLLFTRWRGHLTGSLLRVALAVSALWAAIIAWSMAGGREAAALVTVAEVLRDAAWLVVVARVLTLTDSAAHTRSLVLAIYGTVAFLFIAVCATEVLRDTGIVTIGRMRILVPAGLVLSAAGIVLVEQVFRNTRSTERWTTKFLWVAVGGIFTVDLLLYAAGLAFGGVPPALWSARGAAMLPLTVLMAVGIRRVGKRSGARLLSQELVLYSSGLVLVGVYLVAMAAASLYLDTIGGSWGGFAFALLIFCGLLLFVSVIMSGRVRALARVLVDKHLHPYRFDYRREWLRLTDTMARSPGRNALADNAVQALAQIVGADAGGLWIRRETGFMPAGGDLAGPDSPHEPLDSAFLQTICERDWIVDLRATRSREIRDAATACVPSWLAGLRRARYVVPLTSQDRAVGFVAVTEPLVHHELDWEDIDLLRAAGRQIAAHVALAESALRLAEAQQFEARSRMVTFIMHDLKNVIGQQQLVVDSAARHKDNPKFVSDAIATIDNSVKRMSSMLDSLRHGEFAAEVRRANLAELCTAAAARCGNRAPVPDVHIIDGSVEVIVSPDRLTSVIENILRNAQDATSERGHVAIQVARATHRALVEIRDDGDGMDAEFVRERLFRPFDSTKGAHGMGIGAYQALQFVRAAGGDISVYSEPGAGTRFVIELPTAGRAIGGAA